MIICCDCGQEIKPVEGCGTGYGIDKEGRKVCYACCESATVQVCKRLGALLCTSWRKTAPLGRGAIMP